MWTSDPDRRRMRREIAALAVAGTCIVVIASPEDPALSTLPVHPLWALALVLAARYGAAGLWLAPALAGALVVADALGGGGGAAVLDRLGRGGDVAALAAACLCAAVGTAHERRKAVLEERVRELAARAAAAEASVEELAKVALALRDRCDRSATSLTFLADAAARLGGADPAAAAAAALALAMARGGARGGSVQVVDEHGALRTLISRGTTAALRDQTAGAARERGAVVSADEVAGVRAEDSDLAAPLLDGDGEVVGVLALRELPYTELGAAARADLNVVARWVAPALAPARRAAVPEVIDDDVAEVVYARA